MIIMQQVKCNKTNPKIPHETSSHEQILYQKINIWEAVCESTL